MKPNVVPGTKPVLGAVSLVQLSGAGATFRRRLFRMWNDCENVIRIANDLEVEPVAAIDAGLPHARALRVLFRLERGMPEIYKEKAKLLVELGFQGIRERGVLVGRPRGEKVFHAVRRRTVRAGAFAERDFA